MSLSRSAKVVLVGAILLFSAFLTVGEIASELLLVTSEMKSPEEFDIDDYELLIYLGTAFSVFIIVGIITLIVGAIIYNIDKKKGIPFVLRKNELVNIKRQTIFSIIPILDLYAAYKVKKLIKYVVIMFVIGLGLGVSIGFADFDFEQTFPTPFNEIIFQVIFIPLSVFLIRKWSKNWNQQFAQLTG